MANGFWDQFGRQAQRAASSYGRAAYYDILDRRDRQEALQRLRREQEAQARALAQDLGIPYRVALLKLKAGRTATQIAAEVKAAQQIQQGAAQADATVDQIARLTDPFVGQIAQQFPAATAQERRDIAAPRFGRLGEQPESTRQIATTARMAATARATRKKEAAAQAFRRKLGISKGLTGPDLEAFVQKVTTAEQAGVTPQKPPAPEKGPTPRAMREDALALLKLRYNKADPQLRQFYLPRAQAAVGTFEEWLGKTMAGNPKMEKQFQNNPLTFRKQYQAKIDKAIDAFISTDLARQQEGVYRTFPSTRAGVEAEITRNLQQADANNRMAAQIEQQIKALNARLKKVETR